MTVDYFFDNTAKFRRIKRDTMKFLETFNKVNTKYNFNFEDFMIVLANYLLKNGYSQKKIEKWFKRINENILGMAQKVKAEVPKVQTTATPTTQTKVENA